jgi:hypothetical protein
MGPVGRRAFSRSRLQFTWTDNESQSRVEQPTIRVNEAFTQGGAQVAGGQHSRVLNLATDYDYVRSIHTVRTGLAVDLFRVHADDTSNYLGTYTFESLAAYEANRPRSYTRRIGDPRHCVHERPGRVVRAGRCARSAQPDAERGRAVRGTDARQRLQQPRATVRLHLVATQERGDHTARQLGNVL